METEIVQDQQRVQYWSGCWVRGRIRGGLLLPPLVRLLPEAPSLRRPHMICYLALKLLSDINPTWTLENCNIRTSVAVNIRRAL